MKSSVIQTNQDLVHRVKTSTWKDFWELNKTGRGFAAGIGGLSVGLGAIVCGLYSFVPHFSFSFLLSFLFPGSVLDSFFTALLLLTVFSPFFIALLWLAMLLSNATDFVLLKIAPKKFKQKLIKELTLALEQNELRTLCRPTLNSQFLGVWSGKMSDFHLVPQHELFECAQDPDINAAAVSVWGEDWQNLPVRQRNKNWLRQQVEGFDQKIADVRHGLMAERVATTDTFRLPEPDLVTVLQPNTFTTQAK